MALGKAGWAVKIALKEIQQAVNTGGKLLSKILGYLDSSTAKYAKNNTTKISNGIDEALERLDDAQDYAQATIKEVLYNSLRAVGVSRTYALPIADAIATTVSFFLL